MIGPTVSRVSIIYCKIIIIVMKINFGERFGARMVLKGSTYFYGNVAIMVFLQMKLVTKGTWDLLYVKIAERLMKLFYLFQGIVIQ